MEFDGEVVLVTGASRGLGRAFALCLGAAGAVVGVNDTGRTDGAEETVRAIDDAGGRAFAVPGRVEEAEALVEGAAKRGGRLDGIVHNAGFIDDKSLRRMTDQQWAAVLDVHLGAAFRLARAGWPHLEQGGRGRIVLISSAAALYGNFGQANYAAAKMGLYGLCRTIALEGKKTGIMCNCVAPFGATEMNAPTLPDALKERIKAEYVAPLVGYLAHPSCASNGGLFEASGGAFKQVRWERSRGLRLDTSSPIGIADVARGWAEVGDFEDAEHPKDMNEALMGLALGGS